MILWVWGMRYEVWGLGYETKATGASRSAPQTQLFKESVPTPPQSCRISDREF
jgi:hypothetical protein